MIAHSKSLDGITFFNPTAIFSDIGPTMYRNRGDRVVMIRSNKYPTFSGVAPWVSSDSMTPNAFANRTL